MRSFRIVDTKFRILKGGKIGLSMSVAMIGGMLSLGSTSANATTYNASNVGSYTGTSTSISNTDGGGYASYNSGWSTSDSRTGTLTISSGNTSGIYVTGSMNSAAVSGYPYVTTSSGNAYYWNSNGSWNSVSGNTARDYLTTTLTTRNYVDGFNTVINLTNGTTIGSGGIAINVQDDTGGSSLLNLSGADITINGSIYVDHVNLTGGTTTFNGSVYSNIDMSNSTAAVFTNAATSIGAINGAGAFVYLNGNNSLTGTVTAATVSLSGNDITFNDNVTAAVNFTAAGDATMANGADLTGDVNFGHHNATFTLSDGSDITGSIGNTDGTNNGSTNGTVNFEKSSVVTGNVGATNNVVDQLNVKGAQAYVHLNSANNGAATYNTTVNHIDYSANKSVVQVDGLLTANSVDMNGFYSRLDLMDEGSTQFVGTVNAGTQATGALTSTTLATRGMVGTLDFGTYTSTINNVATTTQGKGTLYVGDNVNVNFTENPATGLSMTNANNATLIFGGDSMVNGNLGTSASSASTVHTIYAGNTGNTVTIANDVYVGAGKFNVGAGTVNFNGDLNGDLVLGTTTAATSVESSAYSTYGNNIATFSASEAAGTVNIAHDKTVTGSITTTANGTGTLNFMGSSSYGSTIGTSAAKFAAVTFNSASTGSGTTGFTATINNNVYANTVTIGNGTNSSMTEQKNAALVDDTGSYDYLGATNMKVWTGGTVANIGSNVTSLGDNLVLSNARDAINLGTAHVAATSFTTNSGAISFTVNTQDITGINQANSTSAGSGQVTTGTLNMSGAEKIQINYVGSLKDAGTYTLISDTGTTGTGTYTGTEANLKVTDNSYVIDTTISRSAIGSDLVLTADRTGGGAYTANKLYVEKSNTIGHFSNNAADVLAGIAANGSQTGDMVQVIQKMELDSYGYGNNQQNLATQVKRLAPIANDSFAQSAMSASTLTLNTVSSRIADLRGDSSILTHSINGVSAGDEALQYGAWVKMIGSSAYQGHDEQYDGYKATSSGAAMGIDKTFSNNVTLGLAFGMTRTFVDQLDFRAGDHARTDSYNVIAYASKDWSHAYLEGALSYAYHTTDSSRTTAVGRTAIADIYTNQYTAKVDAGYRFNVKDKATITPFLSVDYTHLDQNEYTETGAGAINLNVKSAQTDRTTLGGGLRVGTKFSAGHTTLMPELKLAAYNYLNQDSQDIKAQYIGGGTEFVTPGTKLDNTKYNVGLGLKGQLSERTSLGLTLDYDRSGDGLFEGYTGQLVANYKF